MLLIGGLFEWAAKFVSCIAKASALTTYNRKLSVMIDGRHRATNQTVTEDQTDFKAIIADALENALKDPMVRCNHLTRSITYCKFDRSYVFYKFCSELQAGYLTESAPKSIVLILPRIESRFQSLRYLKII